MGKALEAAVYSAAIQQLTRVYEGLEASARAGTTFGEKQLEDGQTVRYCARTPEAAMASVNAAKILTAIVALTEEARVEVLSPSQPPSAIAQAA